MLDRIKREYETYKRLLNRPEIPAGGWYETINWFFASFDKTFREVYVDEPIGKFCGNEPTDFYLDGIYQILTTRINSYSEDWIWKYSIEDSNFLPIFSNSSSGNDCTILGEDLESAKKAALEYANRIAKMRGWDVILYVSKVGDDKYP